jgi:hypothetical protein
MESKNVNSNGDSVVARNLININILIFENCENRVQKERSYVIFSIRCHDITYLTSHVQNAYF